jgi:tetratricopeptide (TPR) repeat protein
MMITFFARRRWISGLFLGCSLSLAEPVPLPPGWHTDFAEAAEIARQSEKQNLVLFTGLKWEQWSQRLHADISSKPEFAGALSSEFVLTHVDLPETPRLENELSEPERRHYALARDFQLSVLPAAYLCTETGRPYDLVGYSDGGLKLFVEEIRLKREAYAAVTAKAAALEGSDRAREIDAWLQTLPESLRTLQSEMIQTVIDSDSDNAAGLRSKYRVMVMLPEARHARYTSSLDKAEKLYLEVLREQRAGGAEARQDLYYELADVYFQMKDYEALLDTLDRAISAAPEGPRMPVLREMMDVFTRQWIYLKHDPERLKAVDYEVKRVELLPGDAERVLALIEQAKTVSPASMRNQVLERMKAELTAAAR